MPDKQERATQTVLEQVEVLSEGWAAALEGRPQFNPSGLVAKREETNMNDDQVLGTEREEVRQRWTAYRATQDCVRFTQLYSVLDYEKRSELLRFATRLVVAQHIGIIEMRTVSPGSNEVTDEIARRIADAEPSNTVSMMLADLNGYGCNVDEVFFPDGKEEVIVNCSSENKGCGEGFADIYQTEFQLARDYKGAFNLPTQDEYCGFDDDDEARRKWLRTQEFESWINEWRSRFFCELFGSTDPERVWERHDRKAREKTNNPPS